MVKRKSCSGGAGSPGGSSVLAGARARRLPLQPQREHPRQHIKMAVPKDAVPSLSECQCGICMDILIEPVTLPCNHTLCNACFQSTVEKANLCCPFCRRRVSSWTRYHTRRNSLINKELWEIIQKHYPKECKLRASGQESEEIVDDYQPVHLLSKPGELRREYEEEISKVEAERRATEEEENKASEEYIQKLLAEEEEEEKRQAEKRRREMEEQLKSDEELARKLSININSFCEEKVMASPVNSRKSDPVTSKLQKKSKNKQTNTGDIQKYLSPKSQFRSASQSEVVQEDKKNSMYKETNSNDVKSPPWQDTETEEDMPTLSPQICLEIQEQSSESSIESPMPQLCASGTEWCLGEVKMRPSNHDKELCVINHERHEARVPYSREAAVEPCSKTESGCTVSDMIQMIGNNTVETENELSHLLISEEGTSKRKKQEPLFETVRDPCFSAKRRKMSSESSSAQEETEINFTEKLLDLERLLFERHKQEEQDRLLALQIQKEVDKEQMKPNPQKGSPGRYQLRATPSPPDKLLNGQRKNSKNRNLKGQADKEHSKPRRGPKPENSQPFKIQLRHSVNGRKMPNSARDHCNESKSVHSLQPSKSQKNIFQMFRRYTK
ncbi:PREDICTED: E3 ubiquitin-protein ligase RNF168 isoform X3 [Miniopterus natalensis]|uniref:E3 ubiquitin-protein ligase RNF168 isoform X1 n=1 Tax=Miniopterus natalensis TaxID=291302 RepID=UPI0007A6BB2F|nr:PREDICTED: E3 ubiquitin-protein ligase RNF168 isoform X1 [Miniopterus natalensis]XP_016055486.1 PREDICTED: E3 ubiquitin-protein ligase RNF168 isoform X2 [Miniopterus natalensis]XP_016055487.1 PREDICTED: E3 ubiquitin-protein ligase RNF168 isoform X3 [Miniopterus natalensis]